MCEIAEALVFVLEGALSTPRASYLRAKLDGPLPGFTGGGEGKSEFGTAPDCISRATERRRFCPRSRSAQVCTNPRGEALVMRSVFLFASKFLSDLHSRYRV